jgi:hypothetical protein
VLPEEHGKVTGPFQRLTHESGGMTLAKAKKAKKAKKSAKKKRK